MCGCKELEKNYGLIMNCDCWMMEESERASYRKKKANAHPTCVNHTPAYSD